MRTLLHTLVLIVSASLLIAAKPPQRRRPEAAQRLPPSPAAIIHTTAGDLHCTLFPKVGADRSRELRRPREGHQRLDEPRLARQEARRAAL